MKRRLLLVSLAIILVFSCTSMAAGKYSAKRKQTASNNCASRKCTGNTCQATIILNLKDDLSDKNKITVQKDDDGESCIIKPSAGGQIPIPTTDKVTGISTLFFTHGSPQCVYYYYNGQWWSIGC